MKKSFTLIEILVVVTIIGLLTLTAVVTYSVFLEQIRASLEMYRSNNDTYPVGSVYATTLSVLTTPVTYIQSLPTDPKSSSYSYYYTGSASDYTIAAYLENGGTVCVAATSCSANGCNYCLGPYGQN